MKVGDFMNMSSIRQGVIALGLLASILTSSHFLSVSAQSPSLSDVNGFEMEPFHRPFSLEKKHVLPELFAHVQAALEQETRLKVQSPADGQVYLSCDGPACREVELTVRLNGPTGPLVYSDDTSMYGLFLGSRFFSVQRKSQNMAKSLVKRLADAYEEAKAGQ